jgi:serine/threonine protein kinase
MLNEEDYNEMIGKEIESKYKIIKLLGVGLYGAVYKAKKLDKDEYVAIKCIPKNIISYQSFNNVYDNLVEMKCENTINVIENSDGDSKYYYIVMELCETSLDKLIYKKVKFTINDLKDFVNQFILILKKMEVYNVIHRDIKPENILVNEVNKKYTKYYIFKLSNFGFGKELEELLSSSKNESPEYRAPEMSEKKYTIKVDLYSIGVILGELISINEEELKPNKELMDLVNNLIEEDPEKRCNLKDFYNNSFLAEKKVEDGTSVRYYFYGEKYEGEFKNGKKNGKGIYYFKT